jgi:hypothetical protein
MPGRNTAEIETLAPPASNSDLDLLPNHVRLLKGLVEDLVQHVKTADANSTAKLAELEERVVELQRHQSEQFGAIHTRIDSLSKGTP